MQPYATVLQCETIPNHGEKFGKVSSGSVRLRGPLIQASFLESEKKLNIYTEETGFRNVCFQLQIMEPELTAQLFLFIDVYPRPEPGKFELAFQFDSDRDAIGSRAFFLLSIAMECNRLVAGLVLQKTGVKGQFRRLGIFSCNNLDTTFIGHEGPRITDIASLIARQRPVLDPDDYEAFDKESGYSTLTII